MMIYLWQGFTTVLYYTLEETIGTYSPSHPRAELPRTGGKHVDYRTGDQSRRFKGSVAQTRDGCKIISPETQIRSVTSSAHIPKKTAYHVQEFINAHHRIESRFLYPLSAMVTHTSPTPHILCFLSIPLPPEVSPTPKPIPPFSPIPLAPFFPL